MAKAGATQQNAQTDSQLAMLEILDRLVGWHHAGRGLDQSQQQINRDAADAKAGSMTNDEWNRDIQKAIPELWNKMASVIEAILRKVPEARFDGCPITLRVCNMETYRATVLYDMGKQRAATLDDVPGIVAHLKRPKVVEPKIRRRSVKRQSRAGRVSR